MTPSGITAIETFVFRPQKNLRTMHKYIELPILSESRRTNMISELPLRSTTNIRIMRPSP
jgi:hypothetical protein